MSETIDWSGSAGDVWAKLWRATDRALEPVGVALESAIHQALPDVPRRALDVGCGPGTTTLAVAKRYPGAAVVGCDISGPLIAIARQRARNVADTDFVVEDAVSAAVRLAPLDLIFSRHGVMFFADPPRAFRTFRDSAAAGAALVFSCFQGWAANPWASELASAAAGRDVPPPGREPGGFAFADQAYARDLLETAGWVEAAPEPVAFTYVVDGAVNPVDDALAFFGALGPASRLLEGLAEDERQAGLERMRAVIARHERNGRVEFPAAAWIWTARAR